MSHCLVNQLIHVMWSTNNQEHHFRQPLKNELLSYITTLVKSKNGKVLATGGSSDHIHLLILLPPDISLGALVGYVKAYSSKWINSHAYADNKFSWQEGYLATSTQEEKVDSICQYFQGDKIRHLSKSYSEELLSILKQQNIEFNKDYLLSTSYSKIYVHAIWSTNNRTPCLDKSIRHGLYNRISDVVTNCKGKVHEIGGIEDHVHILMETPKGSSLSDLIREMKTASTHWLKSVSREYRQFEWQTGYGAFTISYSNLDVVRKYIQNQEEHHQQNTCKDEWENFFISKSFATVPQFAPPALHNGP